MIKILKYFGEILFALAGIFSLVLWAIFGLPTNHTYFLLIFFIVYILLYISLELKNPKKYGGKESQELRTLILNEALTHSTMLLSIGFAAVVTGITLSNSNESLSLVLIIMGGFMVIIGQAISKFIYQPRVRYVSKIGKIKN